MTKILIEAELEYEEDIMHSDDWESRQWFYEDILLRTHDDAGEPNLILHSNELGDSIGILKIIKITDYDNAGSSEHH